MAWQDFYIHAPGFLESKFLEESQPGLPWWV
jgi:hypothetical protein